MAVTRSRSVLQPLREMAAHRGVFRELVRRDLHARVAGSRFGLLWSFLNPAIQLTSYGLIFGYLYSGGQDGDPRAFVGSLFCGLWPWWAFHEGTMRGLSALVDQGALLRKIPMPPALAVLAAVTSSFLLQMIGFLMFLIVFALGGLLTPSALWLAIPVIAAAGWLLTAGLALVLAPSHLLVRDTGHVVSAVLTVGFFVSPVLYPADMLPGPAQDVAVLNPMTGLLGLYRAAVLGADWPSVSALAVLGVALAAVWWCAAAVFERLDGVLDEYW